MDKCIGCGSILQYNDNTKEGYAKENSIYCERCFRIKNYGEYKKVLKDNNNFLDILSNISKDDLVILVMDLLNLPENLDIINNKLSNNVIVVLTKRDMLPKVLYEEKLLNYIDKYNINYKDKLVISSNKNYNIDNLMDKINIYNKTNKVYIVGYTNSGKSTLINKLIYNYSDEVKEITTSMLPNTTLNTIEIKLNNITLIDTPGILNNYSIENYVDTNILKKINSKKNINPITYQIKKKNYITIENIFSIELSNNNITLFISNNLNINRYYKNPNLNLKYEELLVKKDEDLVIPGMGFIKFTKNEKVVIGIIEGSKVYTRKSLI